MRQGAGVLLVARDTGRVLLLKRSESVSTEPGTWAIPGGKVDRGETVQTAAIRELREEAGYGGPMVVSAKPIFILEGADLVFSTYIGLVEHEFEPWLNWESDDAKWCRLSRLPRPIHFGVKEMMRLVDVDSEARSICLLP